MNILPPKSLISNNQSIPCYIGLLEQVRRKTEERIIQIKTETENVDKERRTVEEKNKKERANKIQNEVIQSHKKNVEIDWNWQELEEKEDCKELAEVSNWGTWCLFILTNLKKSFFICETLKFNLDCNTYFLSNFNRISRLKKLHAPRSSRIRLS